MRNCEKLSPVEIVSSNPVLAVHDLARSAAWYREVLGCEIANPDPGNWTFCRLGTIDFMLGRCPDAMPAWDLGDHSYVAYLRVDDVQAFYDRAEQAGARDHQTSDRRTVGHARVRPAISRRPSLHVGSEHSRLKGLQESADMGVEHLWRFDVAHVAGAGDHHEPARRARRV
jgi:catechol 2,3-dioxygenase-like lactoylglutathione lyase family enzyme